MATPATPLLAELESNLTSRAQSSARFPTPLYRPPTPDPRHTPTPHLPQPFNPSTSTTSSNSHQATTQSDSSRRRLRKKPTAIYVGDECQRPVAIEADTPLAPQYPSHTSLSCILPLPPSTPSPRFATSPSLSSGSTLQSSPALTPKTAHFPGSYSEPPPTATKPDAIGVLTGQGTYGLRRAKRLPHRSQDLWEVHAVVHIGPGSAGREAGQRSRSEECHAQTRDVKVAPISSQPPPVSTFSREQTAAPSTKLVRKDATYRDRRLKGLHGIHSESASREGGLRRAEEEGTSTYSLSKYHFPAPPGDYRVGLSGDLQHPKTVHYRGASFELVNPHASLLLSASRFEPPEEQDRLIDDYLESPDTMPRALYTDPATARRNIMGLEGPGDPNEAVPASNETSASSLVPSRPPSDPFDLRVSDVPTQAATPARPRTTEDNTIGGIVDHYDYTGEIPYEHEDTLRALECGAVGTRTPCAFNQVPRGVQEHMSEEFSGKSSDLPTSDRTYGDTNQLLQIPPQYNFPGLSPQRLQMMDSDAFMRPSPVRTTTEMTLDSTVRSASASMHSANSPLESVASDTTERPRGDRPEPALPRDVAFNFFPIDGANDDADWETTRTDDEQSFRDRMARASQDSYANTSTYDERYRLSAMSDTPVRGPVTYANRMSLARSPEPTPRRDADDVERATNALHRIYHEKVLEQNIIPEPAAGHQTLKGKGKQRADGGNPWAPGARRDSAIQASRNNDIELEEIRKNNPQAVREAADQLFAQTVAADIPMPSTPTASQTPLDRLRGVLSRTFSRAEIATPPLTADPYHIPQYHQNEEDLRYILADTPSNLTVDQPSGQLEFSESMQTFRTVRGTAIPSVNNSRTGLDYGERPLPSPKPAAVRTPDNRRPYRPPTPLDPSSRIRIRSPARHIRRPAISSQTSLRALITSGSPTSNIQGLTDPEMHEASRRWDLRPRHYGPCEQRYTGRNATGPFPRAITARPARPNPNGRMLVSPDEITNEYTLHLQERLSERYLIRMMIFPPLCFAYHVGKFDYLIERKTKGYVKTMSEAKKAEALSYGVLASFLYAIFIVCIVIGIWSGRT